MGGIRVKKVMNADDLKIVLSETIKELQAGNVDKLYASAIAEQIREMLKIVKLEKEIIQYAKQGITDSLKGFIQ